MDLWTGWYASLVEVALTAILDSGQARTRINRLVLTVRKEAVPIDTLIELLGDHDDSINWKTDWPEKCDCNVLSAESVWHYRFYPPDPGVYKMDERMRSLIRRSFFLQYFLI
ncbi:hypothetical protein BGW36DRAFT_217430 [Talaromyces proteolyticus]|uniref:Uncharacterized protein n=1 Tax=Talaromyces proteolyticus TaxID=1131652 RepID=A0AAD4KRU5_9EURO|nr:uncharacterized protein BGW36DRAFT_217430 [Talaromyces proteolyticus]KAH8694157.1 hypothetical protein BGW36DRAFT_217430 [Talaromyces proteolyticus]